MKKKLFDELVASVREGGAILCGDRAAVRAFAVEQRARDGTAPRRGLGHGAAKGRVKARLKKNTSK